MNRSNLIAIPVPFTDDSIKVEAVRWTDTASTTIEVVSKRTGRSSVVEFESVIGLRLLDELDLATTWISADSHNLKASWMFRVEADGWLSLESTRDDFYATHLEAMPMEYLIAGYQMCVSILSNKLPTVLEIYSN